MSDSFDFEFDHPFGGEMDVVRIQGSEGISELFEFNIEFVDTDPDAALLSADDAIGKEMHVRWKFGWSERGFTGTSSERDVHGLCTDFHFLGEIDLLHHYEVTLRPKFWLATRKINSRFFLDKSLNDILNTVLDEHQVTIGSIDFTTKSDTLHYTVQYQETNFAFLCRLLEKYGVAYHFKHTASAHEIHIHNADGMVESYGALKFHPKEGGVVPEPHLTHVTSAARLRSNSAVVRDWDHATAGAVLNAENSISRAHASGENELFDYPAGWTSETSAHGTRLAEVVAEVETAKSQRLLAMGDVPDFKPGQGFSITENPVAGDGTGYILLRAQHTIDVKESFRSGGGMSDNAGYRGSYEAIPDRLKYPPPKITPWPRISGPQTAVVVGEEGEEVDVDDEGRILVRFHWDREEQASCRIRVSQIWAGNHWGTYFVPRIGMEVVVDFLGGDPDRPLVTGTVYNSVNVPSPNKWPSFKTASGFKSNSSKGGDGFNQIGFRDEKDNEKVYVRAEKDMLRRVYNDDFIEVTKDQTVTIGGTRNTEITSGDDNLVLKGETGEDKYGNSISGTGNRSVTLQQGDDTLTIEMGDLTIGVDSGKIEIEAATSIELKVGGSSIKMEPSKITVKSVEISVEATGQMTAKGNISTFEGSAVNNIKGGMVKIN